MILLYDPKTNVITETTYEYLTELTGQSIDVLRSYRSLGRKIKGIGCYILHPKTTVQQRKEWYSKVKYADEHWVPVIGSNGDFLISNYGRVKRICRTKTVFILPYLRKKKLLAIKVTFQGVYKEYRVANLVAAHFLGEPKTGQVLRHKNGIRTDDFAGNLEYITKEELGKKTGYMSSSKPVVQIDPDTGEIINEFRSAREAGRKTYMSYQTVLNVCNGVHKCTVDGHVFQFAEDYEDLAL